VLRVSWSVYREGQGKLFCVQVGLDKLDASLKPSNATKERGKLNSNLINFITANWQFSYSNSKYSSPTFSRLLYLNLSYSHKAGY
jgi:hypothetical protein